MQIHLIKQYSKALLVTVAVGAGAWSFTAPAQSSTSGTSTQPSSSDKHAVQFLKQAARDNAAEIGMAELGARKAQNAQLKSFCQQLQQDHTQANQQLQPIAQKYGVQTEQSLSHKEEKEMSKLEKASGADFDKDFALQMLRDHQKDIAKYQRAASEVQAPEVKQFAQSMLPKLQQHFQQAATLARSVGVDQSTITSITSKAQKAQSAIGGTGSDFGEQPSTGGSDDQNAKGSGARELKQGRDSESH